VKPSTFNVSPPPWLLLDAVAGVEEVYQEPPVSAGGFLLRGNDKLDDLVRVVDYDDRVRVTWAGTRNVEQWISNLKRLGGRHWNADGSFSHYGIHEAMHAMEFQLMDCLRDLGCFRHEKFPKPVDYHGHSRGGGMWSEFARRRGRMIALRHGVTMGSMRPGDKFHQEEVAGCFSGRVIRLTNNNDPVPWLPGGLRRYKRAAGEPWHFDRRGRLAHGGLGFAWGVADGMLGRAEALARDFTWLDGVKDHKMESGYGPAVRGWAEAAGPR
jgi:hypothetical protein